MTHLTTGGREAGVQLLAAEEEARRRDGLPGRSSPDGPALISQSSKDAHGAGAPALRRRRSC